MKKAKPWKENQKQQIYSGEKFTRNGFFFTACTGAGLLSSASSESSQLS